MSEFEIKTIVNPQTADREYIREVAETKRALELWTMEPPTTFPSTRCQ